MKRKRRHRSLGAVSLDNRRLRNEICCAAAPSAKGRDYGGKTTKGNVQFLKRNQHNFHLRHCRKETFFKRIIPLYLKPEKEKNMDTQH